MLNSAISILQNYLDDVTPYNVYSIEMERGSNLEDLYYLCNVNGKFYVVFETDYISPTPYQAAEATELFAQAGIRPLGWLTKKGISNESEGSTVPADSSIGTDASRKLLVTKPNNSYLLHAVLVVKGRQVDQKINPAAYGY